jgi:hypothetical protein
VVGEYERYLREGGVLDRDVVEFRYWRRARGIENRPWGRDWRRGGSAMPRWRGGGERVVEHHWVAVLTDDAGAAGAHTRAGLAADW